MSRVLILSWDGGGNTPSALNLGARLVRRGDQVRMTGWDSMEVRAAASGLEFTTYPSDAPWPFDLRYEDGWDRIAAALFGAATESDVAAEAETFRPDVVVTDCMLTAGDAAARRLDLPVASLVHVRYGPFVHGGQRGPRHRRRRPPRTGRCAGAPYGPGAGQRDGSRVGMPMVCVRQGRDQPLNAASVEELGAGLTVPPGAPPEELAAALRTVLTGSRFRTAAQRLAASAAAVGNGELATDLIQALADTVTAPR